MVDDDHLAHLPDLPAFDLKLQDIDLAHLFPMENALGSLEEIRVGCRSEFLKRPDALFANLVALRNPCRNAKRS